jgi:hypothetical protein
MVDGGADCTTLPQRAPKTPRIVELFRKSIEWQALFDSGKIANQADIACQERITRARVTRVLGQLLLACHSFSVMFRC